MRIRVRVYCELINHIALLVAYDTKLFNSLPTLRERVGGPAGVEILIN